MEDTVLPFLILTVLNIYCNNKLIIFAQKKGIANANQLQKRAKAIPQKEIHQQGLNQKDCQKRKICSCIESGRRFSFDFSCLVYNRDRN